MFILLLSCVGNNNGIFCHPSNLHLLIFHLPSFHCIAYLMDYTLPLCPTSSRIRKCPPNVLFKPFFNFITFRLIYFGPVVNNFSLLSTILVIGWHVIIIIHYFNNCFCTSCTSNASVKITNYINVRKWKIQSEQLLDNNNIKCILQNLQFLSSISSVSFTAEQ